eukprot:g1570.t1
MVWKVPADKESEMDAFWQEHEEWMRGSHTAGSAGDDSTSPRLMEFYIAKGKEMKNPMAPEEGETGKLIYNMSETYYAPAGIGKHMELGQSMKPEWFEKMTAHNAAYGHHMDVGSQTILTCLADDGATMMAPKGAPSIHGYWRFPASMEAEVDAFWKEHEAWMRSSHTMGPAGDDSTGPRLYSFYIHKGKELKNPLAPEEGETGEILYGMSETYVAAAGIAKHMELGQQNKPEWFAKLMEYNKDYLLHMDVGSQAVFTNLGPDAPPTPPAFDIRTLDGKMMKMEPADDAHCAMKAFFNFMACPCLGAPTMVQHVEDKDGQLDIYGSEAKVCGGLCPHSPCPCFVYCGVGPCAAAYRFKTTDVDDKYTANGSTMVGCGACLACTNHDGNHFHYNADHDGTPEKPIVMIAGKNPTIPLPCLWGKPVLKFYEVADRKGAPLAASSGTLAAVAPSAEAVER